MQTSCCCSSFAKEITSRPKQQKAREGRGVYFILLSLSLSLRRRVLAMYFETRLRFLIFAPRPSRCLSTIVGFVPLLAACVAVSRQRAHGRASAACPPFAVYSPLPARRCTVYRSNKNSQQTHVDTRQNGTNHKKP